MCALMYVLLLPGLVGPCFTYGTHKRDDPLCCVTFELRQVPQGALQEVKREAMAVNEAAYSGVIVGTATKVWSVCGVVLLHPHRK